MFADRIATRYATPIMELAEEKGVLDKVKLDMEFFINVCEESRDFALMLKNPILPHRRKAEILKKAFKGKVNELMLRAFDLITRKKRENLLENIAKEFLYLYHVKKGFVEVCVTTSIKLDVEMKKAFEKLVKEITGKKPILKEKVDSEIVGGYILKLGDCQIDESISGQLKELKLEFSKNK